MNTLSDFLIHNDLVTEAKFDKELTLDNLNEYPHLNFHKCPKDIQKALLKVIQNLYGSSEPFVLAAPDANYFKIPRAVASVAQVKDISCKSGTLHINKDSSGLIKFSATYSENGKTVTKQLGSTGNGSLGKVSTSSQETAMCLVWNAFANAGGKLDLNANNYSHIKKIIKGLGPEVTNNKTWLASFSNSVISILKFLKAKGVKRPFDYRATRYGSELPCAQSHMKFLNDYISMVQKEYEGTDQKIQKDNYDPSDILLYKKNCESMKKLVDCTGKTLTDVFEEYSKLYQNNILFGISLKQAKGDGKFQEFNIYKGREMAGTATTAISSAKGKPGGGAGREEIITGKFVFDGAVDPNTITNDDPQPINETTLFVNMRSFGKAGVGMDVKASIGPALGKIPARIWRRALGLKDDPKVSLEECNKAWDKLFGSGVVTNKKKLEIFKTLVSAGIKNGPWCLPFVLIH